MNSNSLTTTYKQFRDGRPMTARERVRYLVLELATLLNKPKFSNQPSVVFMAFHYLFEDNEKEFNELLATLASEFNFLTVSEAIHGLEEGNLQGNNMCFTSDDGFKSNIKAGEILKEYGASCCFFLCPEFIGQTDVSRVTRINKESLGGPPIEFMNWDDIDFLLKSGHEVGNHTLEHIMLSNATENEMRLQIEGAHEKLTKYCGPVRHFAAPYGHSLSFDARAVAIVKNLRYDSFFTTKRGEHFADTEDAEILKMRHHFEPYWPADHTRFFIYRHLK